MLRAAKTGCCSTCAQYQLYWCNLQGTPRHSKAISLRPGRAMAQAHSGYQRWVRAPPGGERRKDGGVLASGDWAVPSGCPRMRKVFNTILPSIPFSTFSLCLELELETSINNTLSLIIEMFYVEVHICR